MHQWWIIDTINSKSKCCGGSTSIAINHCKKALELNDADYDIMNRLAWLYAKKGVNTDKGLELSKKTIEARPGKAEYLDTISELYYVRGEIDKAVENVKKAIELTPDDNYYKQQLWRFTNTKPQSSASSPPAPPSSMTVNTPNR